MFRLTFLTLFQAFKKQPKDFGTSELEMLPQAFKQLPFVLPLYFFY